MSGIRLEVGFSAAQELHGGTRHRSLAQMFQSMLQGAGKRLPVESRQSSSSASRSGGVFGPQEKPAPDLATTMLGKIAAAQGASNDKPVVGVEQDFDDAGMNLLQYVLARAQSSATDPADAWILHNHAAYIVMNFAGYQPAGLSFKEIVDRYLAKTEGTHPAAG